MRWSAIPSLIMLACKAWLAPLPPRTTLAERLAMFPKEGWPLEGAVTLYWNDRQVPFIDAETDGDLAFALGVVHGHLRLGQMEMMRRASQGRLSEMVGAAAIDLDHMLRALDFSRAVPGCLAIMPEAEREWLERFTAGINLALERADPLPHEFRVLGLRREPWRSGDVLTIGRMAGADLTWRAWFQLLRWRERPEWPGLWKRLLAEGTFSMPSHGNDAPTDLAWLTHVLDAYNPSGSNCLVVAPERSATGAALIASDPHLGLLVPGVWLLAGFRSPSHHAVGLMLPGLPFIALGRNPHIAWGGTNLHAASSDLFDVSDLGPEAFTFREETIAVRWGRPRRVRIRECAHGPVLSDAPPFRSKNPDGAPAVLAMRWQGHAPTDDMGSLVRMNRAENWEQFKAALDGFSVSGQNFLYADTRGGIGQLIAAHLPSRPKRPPADMVLPLSAEEAWETMLSAGNLPSVFGPESGYLASANNRPAEGEVPVGFFFSPNDRMVRFHQVLSARSDFTPDDLEALLLDVTMNSALAIRDALVARLQSLPLRESLNKGQRTVLGLLAAWDGTFHSDSRGALAYQQVLAPLARHLVFRKLMRAYQASWRPLTLLLEDIRHSDPSRLAPALEAALNQAARGVRRFDTWGDVHRLGLRHPLGALPLAGRKYRMINHPAEGGSDTIHKTGHPLTHKRHFSGYGSCARHVSNLADPDDNRFVLLGGQDGWLGSTTLLDQVALWERGETFRMPLLAETAAETFPHRMTISPENGDSAKEPTAGMREDTVEDTVEDPGGGPVEKPAEKPTEESGEEPEEASRGDTTGKTAGEES
ncbi:MAG: penicillin acylase family protein [bacterium]